VTSELNVRYSVTNMAKNLCEQETKNPATSCTSKTLPSTEFNEGYTYKDMIDDTVNLVYYGGGRATDHMTNAQKAYVSMWRLKNFHEYSFYLYFVGILFIIGLIALVALFYHKGPVLASSLNSSLNITLFLLFMWHAINFAFWVGYIPQVLSKIARTSGESLRALVFGADFGFSLSKLHLFVAVISLVLFIIIIIVRRARSR
ncbi:MAG: hypothetical protein KKE20_07200, partial [Nanoarchaeota archaeon]|nr:hypothetical protein [Nanoarchaeota archaeon]